MSGNGARFAISKKAYETVVALMRGFEIPQTDSLVKSILDIGRHDVHTILTYMLRLAGNPGKNYTPDFLAEVYGSELGRMLVLRDETLKRFRIGVAMAMIGGMQARSDDESGYISPFSHWECATVATGRGDEEDLAFRFALIPEAQAFADAVWQGTAHVELGQGKEGDSE